MTSFQEDTLSARTCDISIDFQTVLTASALTDLFYRSGALQRGVVTHLEIEQQTDTIVSTLTFLRAMYSQDSSPKLPKRLILKQLRSTETAPGDISEHELDFYSRLAPKLSSPPVVQCFVALDGVLILEDLSNSHTNLPWSKIPSASQCAMAVEVLAQLHAQWWEDPQLGVTLGTGHSTETLTSMVEGIATLLPGFCGSAASNLSPARRNVLERVFSSRLRPWLRLTDPRALAVIHGDAHTWNFLFPRHEGRQTYLIDWQLWHVDVGARDLAFMIALHWTSDQRRNLELPLLRRYHEQLVALGVTDYSWDDLWLDYRLCAIRNLTIPILYWKRGTKQELWHHRLACAMVSYEELNCNELL